MIEYAGSWWGEVRRPTKPVPPPPDKPTDARRVASASLPA